MKKTGMIWLIALMCMFFPVNVWADISDKKTEPDIKTDYYMIVESKQGGIDIYAHPDLESAKLNEELIPNGTSLHIEGEVEDTAHSRTWGYVQYHGMYGYVPLDDCRPAQSRKEAIDSELYIAGRDHVDYNADYDVRAYASEGTQKLYQGPGEKYGEVPGVRDIKNGESLHVTQDAELVDGSHWGVTTVDGKEGWINLDDTEDAARKRGELSENDTDTKKEFVTMITSEEAELSKMPEATVTPEATEAPTATVTPEATEAPTVTVTPEATEAPTATETLEAAETSTSTEVPKETAASVSEESNSLIQTPFWWIAAAAVIAVAGVLIYHFKKK
ncbi:hypothetical protein JCM17039_23150 [Blautia glucerasea]